MPATTGKIGYGSQLLMDDGVGVYTALANVVSIDGPNEVLGTVEGTHLGSDNSQREHVATLKDGGDISLTLHFDPTAATQNSTTGLRKKYVDRTLTNFRLVFAGFSQRFNFAAYVTAISPAISLEGITELSVTLKVSGVVTPSAHP